MRFDDNFASLSHKQGFPLAWPVLSLLRGGQEGSVGDYVVKKLIFRSFIYDN